ncbi:MAG: hypothetical protein LBT21_00855 [Oscillospiraceae bacterium]|nr:hypothetical protein [Oscillospiraceae bacterium]
MKISLRSAKETENSPYRMSTVCYIEVDKSGNVSQVHHKNKSDIQKVLEAYQRAANKSSTIYAVWPGNWSGDLFVIDDLDAFAKSFELI